MITSGREKQGKTQAEADEQFEAKNKK